MGLDGYYEDVFDERNLAPQTNYDRIRNMSVDEMAELMYEYTDCDETLCPVYKNCKNKSSLKCIKSIKQWLLQEEV